MNLEAVVLALVMATGLGVVMGASRNRLTGSQRTLERVAPFLVGPARASALRGHRWVAHDFRPVAGRVAPRISSWLGHEEQVARALQVAGSSESVLEFRWRQLLATCAGIVAGFLMIVCAAAAGEQVRGIALIAWPLTGACVGYLGVQWRLGARGRARIAVMERELPVIAELTALSVTAGQGVAAAFERIATRCSGPLAGEIEYGLAVCRNKQSFTGVLGVVSSRVPVATVQRLMSTISLALERGTPLADVLRAQACDARDAHRRQLMVTAGMKEIAMMVPVVFLVLPVTVVFALFPGFVGFSVTG